MACAIAHLNAASEAAFARMNTGGSAWFAHDEAQRGMLADRAPGGGRGSG